MYLDKTAAVARLTPNSGNTNQEQYQAVSGLENIALNIQPASAELTAVTEGAYGRTFLAFAKVSNIKISDQITVSGTGDVFIVKGINDHFYGALPHLEIVLFKK